MRQLGLALATLAVAGSMAEAGNLRKVWDFEAGSPGVYALSFSPDGQHIVAVVGRSWQDEFVLVLDVRDPQANKRRLEVNPELGPYINHHLSWSPSGQQLVLGRTEVQLAIGKTCSLEGMAGLLFFVGEGRVVTQAIRPVGPLRPDTLVPRIGHAFLDFFNSACQSAGSWDVPNEYGLFDSSAERGLVFVRQGSGAAILDASSRTAIQQLPWMDSARFANSGNAICGVIGAEWEVSARCLDVDTGKELATSKIFTHLEINPALHARRVVLSDYGRKFDFIYFRWYLGSLKNRVVWDFGTGKQLVSWRPKSQTVFSRDGALGGTQPYAFDISPDGDYIVEGGAGTVSLYRIEP